MKRILAGIAATALAISAGGATVFASGGCHGYSLVDGGFLYGVHHAACQIAGVGGGLGVYGNGTPCVDADGNGVCDYSNIHSCGNGIPCVDADGNGVCDYYNVHNCGTGAWCVDADGNGVCDYSNIHSCGNGIPCVDADGNGVCDYYNVHNCGTGAWCVDADGNGVCDYYNVHDCGTGAWYTGAESGGSYGNAGLQQNAPVPQRGHHGGHGRHCR